MALEFITSVAAPYLAMAGVAVEWLYGDYDDSLTFAAAGDADAELIWLDYSRFGRADPTVMSAWCRRPARPSARAHSRPNPD